MTEFEQIKKDIIEQLEKVNYTTGDFSDIANEIGIAIGKYTIQEDAKDKGFDVNIFMFGLTHGISLINKTH